MEKIVLATGLAALMAFGFIPKENSVTKSFEPKHEIIQPVLEPVVKNIAKEKTIVVIAKQNRLDTVPQNNKAVPPLKPLKSISSNTQDGKTVIEAVDESGKKFLIKKQNGQVVGLSVNGKEVPQQEIKQYGELFDAIEEQQVRRKKSLEEMQEMRAMQDEKRREMEIERNEMRREHENQERELLRQHEMEEREMRQEKQRELQEMRKEQMDLKQNMMERQREEMLQMKDSMRGTEEMQRKLIRDNRMQESNDEIGQIINDLQENQLIKSTDPLSFKLTDQELIVNGKKQSSTIQQNFKKRYIHNKSDSFIYSRTGGSRSITINRNR
jgi:hypothetical protein